MVSLVVNAKQAKKLRQYARAYVTGEVRTLRRELQAQLLQMRHRAEVHRPQFVPAFVWERLVASVFARAVQ